MSAYDLFIAPFMDYGFMRRRWLPAFALRLGLRPSVRFFPCGA